MEVLLLIAKLSPESGIATKRREKRKLDEPNLRRRSTKLQRNLEFEFFALHNRFVLFVPFCGYPLLCDLCALSRLFIFRYLQS